MYYMRMGYKILNQRKCRPLYKIPFGGGGGGSKTELKIMQKFIKRQKGKLP
jgi:hypothetical protein